MIALQGRTKEGGPREAKRRAVKLTVSRVFLIGSWAHSVGSKGLGRFGSDLVGSPAIGVVHFTSGPTKCRAVLRASGRAQFVENGGCRWHFL